MPTPDEIKTDPEANVKIRELESWLATHTGADSCCIVGLLFEKDRTGFIYDFEMNSENFRLLAMMAAVTAAQMDGEELPGETLQ